MKAMLHAVAVVAFLVAACSSSPGAAVTPAAGDPTTDKLAQIQARGTLVGYAELDYPPQSIKVDGATRADPTKCQPNQLTAPEVTGFDIETHKLVASALGVEACFVSPTFSEVTAGNWGDRFDLAYASGAINATRMEHLWMTQPYYYVPQRFIVRTDSPATELSDLDGKTIGTCTSCTVEAYLQGTLKIPGVDLVQKVKDPKLAGYETEFPGIDDLVARQDRRVPGGRAGRPPGHQGRTASSITRRARLLDVSERLRRQGLEPGRGGIRGARQRDHPGGTCRRHP